MNLNIARLIQLLLSTGQHLFSKECTDVWTESCVKLLDQRREAAKEWQERGELGLSHMPYPWDCQGSAGHFRVSLLFHLCTCVPLETTKPNGTSLAQRLIARFICCIKCTKTKTLHSNHVSNNSQDLCCISVDCQAKGEQASIFFMLKYSWSILDVNIHTGIISGRDWDVHSAWVTTDVQEGWWSAGLEIFLFFQKAQTCLHKWCCLLPWGCGTSVVLGMKSTGRACVSSSSTGSRASCAERVTVLTHSHWLVELFCSFVHNFSGTTAVKRVLCV